MSKGNGTAIIKRTITSWQFWAAVAGALVMAGSVLAASSSRLSTVGEGMAENRSEIKDVQQRLHVIDVRQAEMAVKQDVVAESVKEIRDTLREMAKGK